MNSSDPEWQKYISKVRDAFDLYFSNNRNLLYADDINKNYPIDEILCFKDLLNTVEEILWVDATLHFKKKNYFFNSAFKNFSEEELFLHKFIFSQEFYNVGFIDPLEEIIYKHRTHKRVLRIDLSKTLPEDSNEVFCFYINDALFEGRRGIPEIIGNECETIKNKIQHIKSSHNHSYPFIANELNTLCNTLLRKDSVNDLRKCIQTSLSKLIVNYKDNEKIVRRIIQAFIWNRINPPWEHLYYIADRISATDSSSGICFGTTKLLSPDILTFLGLFVDRYFASCYYMLHYSEIQLSSTRSAIGSIMSRNGSHNIGSHVLSALTHHIGTMTDDRVLYQYIQQRMDYIANVTTEFPSWTTSTMFVGDIMKTFLSQHHLLEYVSESEGLHSYRFQEPSIKGRMPKEQKEKIRLHISRIERGKENIEITRFIRYGTEEYTHYPPNDNFNIWDKDIALAIPGGVVGQHAFFTILENIIRNAAKHGWAEFPKKNDLSDDKPLNLDIYISFEEKEGQDEKGRYIEFTVWDNMSNVLLPLTKNDKIETNLKLFLVVLSRVPETESASLSLDTGETIARSAWIKKTFFNQNNDKDFVDTLRSVTRENFRVFLKKPLTSAEIEAIKNQKDYKTFVPLNMQQQILLTQTFIGEQGELKRENWGMAEMRISAGFLWHYAVEQIGGLLDQKSDEYIIKPVPVDSVVSCPDNLCGNKECSRTLCKYKGRNNLLECPKKRNRHYHLGYRFKVHLPREILIVFQSTDRAAISNITSDKAAEFKKQGVYFAVAENNELRRFPEENGKHRTYATNNFDYVVLPSLDTIKTNPAAGNGVSQPQDPSDYEILSCLPFRLLVGTTADANKTERKKALINYKGIFDLLQKDIGEKSAIDLKCIVYKAWLDHLKARYGMSRKDDELKNNMLTMQLQTEGSSGSSQGLFTNYDLLEYVFRNLYHSVASGGDIPDDSDVGMITKMIALYPAAYKELPEKDILSDDIYTEIKEIINRICTRIREAYPYLHRMAYSSDPDNELKISFHDDERPWSMSPDDWKKQKELIKAYYERLKDESGVLEFIRSNPVEAFEQKISDFTAIDDFSEDEMMAMINEDPGDSPFSALVDPVGSSVLAKELFAAYRNCNVMLRRREDRIATLPPIYSMDGMANGTNVIDSQASIDLIKKAGIDISPTSNPRIKYCRHDKNRKKNMIYAEGLSGSQSYLNQLHRITHSFRTEDIGLFVRLAENALLRVLIIDERVSKFLQEHEQMEMTYKAMNIDVADISDKKFGDADNMTLPLKKLDLHDQESLKEWDILIIHQGIIDKWFSNHDKKKVRELIRNLQKDVPYTVITTGRGRPDNVPKEAKILPFSTIESTLFCEYPEKLLLVGTVMNILPLEE